MNYINRDNVKNKTKKNRMMNVIRYLTTRKDNQSIIQGDENAYMGLCELVTQMKQSTWQRSDIDFERDMRELEKLDI